MKNLKKGVEELQQHIEDCVRSNMGILGKNSTATSSYESTLSSSAYYGTCVSSSYCSS